MSRIGLLRMPRTVTFGSGSRLELKSVVGFHGSRAFVVADPALTETEYFEQAIAQLRDAEIEVKVAADIEPELPVEALHDIAAHAERFAPDVIVAWGGGSALDAGKLVALLITHAGELPDYYGENRVPGPVVPVVAVPTTAGTGSEVTPVAVVSDSSRELKVGVSSPHLIPHAAIVDPDLTLGAPTTVTAYSGIDALVHAIESYTAKELMPSFDDTLPVFIGRNALSAPLSIEAVRMIGSSLESAVSSPEDHVARNSMAQGSLLAGIAFGNSGTHLSHAIQYPLGAYTRTPHGLGTGLLLPYVLEACKHAIFDRLADIGQALGVSPDAQSAIERIVEINNNIGLPPTLADIGITRADLPRIADLSLASERLTAIAPIPVDSALMTRILEAAFTGDLSLLNHG
jgi:alcohol dehydrogenase